MNATRTAILLYFCVLAILSIGVAMVRPADEVNIDRTGLALGGYDPVTYFTKGKPSKGNFQITAEYQGATYRFANKANRELFQKSPRRYAPQYGGYCAYGIAKGAKFTADPTIWKVVNGKLYVNLDQSIGELFNKDVSGYITKANQNWPGLHTKPAR